MVTLGFSIGHDMGAVIIKDGEVLVGITEERITRIKHDGGYSYRLPKESIKYCLDSLGISFDDVDKYVYSTTEIPDNYDSEFHDFTGVSPDKLEYIPHHLAHAISTYSSSGFRESAVIVADASGSEISEESRANQWFPGIKVVEGERLAESITIYNFSDGLFEEVYKKWTPLGSSINSEYGCSLGLMYSTGSLQLILDEETNSWPAGKLMGLASYANPDFVQRYPDVNEVGDDLKIRCNLIEEGINHKSDFQSKADVAGIYQREQERIMLHLARKAKDLTGNSNLCVSGGSFLNCNSNELIEKSGIFDDVYYLPCSDDSGIPLGCAWYGQDNRIGKGNLSPYLGRTYSDKEVLDAIFSSGSNLLFRQVSDDVLFEEIAREINKNKVVGWMQSGSEIGPRALGNRSILANPSCPWMVNYINSEIKEREWYRPFAPSVLGEYQSEIFDLDTNSPYMLITTRVKEEWSGRIPAVTHIDQTSRYQTVSNESNPRYHSLIKEFHRISGIPLLLNTSFNGRGEPIVESPADAIRTFLRCGIHTLVINDFIITRAD